MKHPDGVLTCQLIPNNGHVVCWNCGISCGWDNYKKDGNQIHCPECGVRLGAINQSMGGAWCKTAAFSGGKPEMGKPSFHVVTWKENFEQSGVTVKIQLVNPDGAHRGLLLLVPDNYLEAQCLECGEHFITRFLRRDDMYNGEREDHDPTFDPSIATTYTLLHHLWTKAVGTADYIKSEWRELERRLTKDQ
jgi:hypothetical protein